MLFLTKWVAGEEMGKKIAVYCASALGKQEVYQLGAERFADWMIKEQYDMVYGGSKVGLMGIISSKLIANGRGTYGVLPDFLKDKEIAQDNLTELHIVQGMHERKQKMMDLADVFIALPGGPGTLEEISEVISWSRLGKHDKPCVFYNINGYYDALDEFFSKMVESGFYTQPEKDTLLFSDSLEEIQNFITTYVPPKTRVYDK